MAHEERPLSGRVVLITGGARRVGAVLVRAFHEAGASLVLHHHRSQKEAAELARELTSLRRDSVKLVQADLLDTPRLPRLIEEARQAFGQLDVLVNNASSFFPTPIGEITTKAWDDIVGTNLKAPLFLA